MPRSRLSTKKLAQRIDMDYFKRPHPFRRLRSILSICLPLLALIWLGWYALARNNRVYSSGTVVPLARCTHATVRRVPSKGVRLVQREGERSRVRIMPRRPDSPRESDLPAELFFVPSGTSRPSAVLQQPQTPPARSATRTCAATGHRPTSCMTSPASTAGTPSSPPYAQAAQIPEQSS